MVAENEFDKEGLDMAEPDKPDDDKVFNIQIDRVVYQVSETRMTGDGLRHVPNPPIPADRDLFEIIPGHPDRKVENDDRILISDGLRFFTAPNTINPGSIPVGH